MTDSETHDFINVSSTDKHLTVFWSDDEDLLNQHFTAKKGDFVVFCA